MWISHGPPGDGRGKRERDEVRVFYLVEGGDGVPRARWGYLEPADVVNEECAHLAPADVVHVRCHEGAPYGGPD